MLKDPVISHLFKVGTRLVSYNHFHSAKVCVCVVCVCACVHACVRAWVVCVDGVRGWGACVKCVCACVCVYIPEAINN